MADRQEKVILFLYIFVKRLIILLLFVFIMWGSWFFVINQDVKWLPLYVRTSYTNKVKRYIQEWLSDMLKTRILNDDDIKILNNKISISYKQSCLPIEWWFSAHKNLYWDWYTFDNIFIIVSYCEANIISWKDKQDIKQILMHEIWHYIYFFKDKNILDFSNICRWYESNCTKSDYINDYAATSVEEDYAESFVYRYLNYKYETEAIKMKNEHFNKLFKQPLYSEFLCPRLL